MYMRLADLGLVVASVMQERSLSLEAVASQHIHKTRTWAVQN